MKYPEITVTLTGMDGNAFAIISKVSIALRRAGVSRDIIIDFRREAMSGDYDHVIQTCMNWVNTD